MIQQKYSQIKLPQRSSALYFIEFRLSARACIATSCIACAREMRSSNGHERPWGNAHTDISDHKGALMTCISSILNQICRFHGSILLLFRCKFAIPREAMLDSNFDGGVITLTQSQFFATHLFRP